MGTMEQTMAREFAAKDIMMSCQCRQNYTAYETVCPIRRLCPQLGSEYGRDARGLRSNQRGRSKRWDKVWLNSVTIGNEAH
jgi:hypothetical protein